MTFNVDDCGAPREKFLPFDPNTRPPSRTPPPLACDSQIHVFGPTHRYPVRNESVFEDTISTLEESKLMHAVIGIERCVLVHCGAVYGADNSVTYDSLKRAGPNYRGACVINEQTTDQELRDLHDVGVRSARFNFFAGVNLIYDPALFPRSVARAADMGWYIRVHPPTGGLKELYDLLDPLGDIQVQLDHYGRPNMDGGPLQDETVDLVVELLKRGNFWVQLSNAHRFTKQGPLMPDMTDVARKYYEAAPDRITWATDWPHCLAREKMENDGDILDYLFRSFPTEKEQQDILVTNPAILHQF